MMMMMTDPADLNNGSNERYLGAFTFAGNYEVKVQAPLDARAVVTSVEELLAPQTPEGDNKYEYYGMLVTVNGDTTDPTNDGVYRLLHNGDPRVIEGWEKLGTGSGFGDDTFISGGTLDSSILTLNYNNGTTPLEIDFTECCGGGLSELYDSAFFDPNNDNVSTVSTVGGVVAPTKISELHGLSFSEVFDLMFFPVQTPGSTPPSNTLGWGLPANPLFEIGDTKEVALSAGASGGSWNNDYPNSTPPVVNTNLTYAGDAIEATITYDGAGSTTAEGALTITGSYDLSDPVDSNYIVQAGTQSWSLQTKFTDGPVAKDSGNNDVDSSLLWTEDVVTPKQVKMRGTYPVYVKTFDNGVVGESSFLVDMSTNPVVINTNFGEGETGAPRFEFWIPKLFGTPTTVVQKVYNDAGQLLATSQNIIVDDANRTMAINDASSYAAGANAPLERGTTHFANGIEYHKFEKIAGTPRAGRSDFEVTI